jgi:hypothetical protein
MASPYWIGQLQEAYPVKPLASLLQRTTPSNQVIYASFPSARPSLNFYSDRQVIPASNSELKQRWAKEKVPYLLLDDTTNKQLNLESPRLIERVAGWVLITKNTP